MKSKALMGILIGFVAVMLAMPAIAQDDDSDDVAIVLHFQIKDGQEDAFMDAVKTFHRDFMADKEGAFHWDWYRIITGEDTGDFVARSGGHNWSDMDAENDWEDEVDDYIEANISGYVEDMQRYLTVTNDEVHNYPDDWSNLRFITLEDWHIKPGKGRQFNEGLETIHGHLMEGDFPVHYGFAYNVSGGYGNTVTLATFHDSWASMADPEPSFGEIMTEAMGEEEMAEFMSGWSETYKPGKSRMMVYLRNLSHFDDE